MARMVGPLWARARATGPPTEAACYVALAPAVSERQYDPEPAHCARPAGGAGLRTGATERAHAGGEPGVTPGPQASPWPRSGGTGGSDTGSGRGRAGAPVGSGRGRGRLTAGDGPACQ
jgi:hypothetical protein